MGAEEYAAWKWKFDPIGFRRAFALGCHSKGVTEDSFVRDHLGMNPVSRWRWVRGLSKPGFETCVEMSEKLGVPFMALIGADGCRLVLGENGQVLGIKQEDK